MGVVDRKMGGKATRGIPKMVNFQGSPQDIGVRYLPRSVGHRLSGGGGQV